MPIFVYQRNKSVILTETCFLLDPMICKLCGRKELNLKGSNITYMNAGKGL